jgi:hypothetical protein
VPPLGLAHLRVSLLLRVTAAVLHNEDHPDVRLHLLEDVPPVLRVHRLTRRPGRKAARKVGQRFAQTDAPHLVGERRGRRMEEEDLVLGIGLAAEIGVVHHQLLHGGEGGGVSALTA